MASVFVDISMSLDGFVAGPNPTLDEPLGRGGERLHEWVFGLASWREPHGLEGGETNADDDLVAESRAATGAVVMGRRMFSGGDGPWEDDPNSDAWWGDNPPFHVPVFVLTHHARETVIKEGGTTFTFVTDGVESAIDQAKAAAAEKDVLIAGGANVIQQCVDTGLVDEIQVHVVPAFLGGGTSLFAGISDSIGLEKARVVDSPHVTHLRYRVVNEGRRRP